MTVFATDYLIIGAGPAGLQLAHELHKNGDRYLVLEAQNAIAAVADPADHPKPEDRRSLLCDAAQLHYPHYQRAEPSPAQAWRRYLQDFAAYYRLAVRCDARVVSIARRDNGFVVRDRSCRVVTAKYVIIATTLLPGTVFAGNCHADRGRHDSFPELTHEWESVNVPNLFFVANAAPFGHDPSGAYRHGVLALARIFACKHHGHSWPQSGLGTALETLAEAITRRILHAESLWQQGTDLCDYVDLAGGGRYLEAVPCRRVPFSNLGRSSFYLTIAYERAGTNPFTLYPTGSNHAENRPRLAVIRVYYNGRLLDLIRLQEGEGRLQARVAAFIGQHLRTLRGMAG